jgi:hypothetical protein
MALEKVQKHFFTKKRMRKTLMKLTAGLKQKNDLREMINKLSVGFITSNLRPTSEQSPRIKYG